MVQGVPVFRELRQRRPVVEGARVLPLVRTTDHSVYGSVLTHLRQGTRYLPYNNQYVNARFEPSEETI